MRYLFLFISFLFLGVIGYSQSGGVLKDTVYIVQEKKTLNCEYLITTLKHGSTIQFIKASNNKFYLRIVTSENIYFGKTDMLEIRSGSKSFYAKNTTNFELKKNTGFFVVEIYKNYIATLKDDGINEIAFGKAVTSYSKQDCNQIKEIAKEFYEKFCAKK